MTMITRTTIRAGWLSMFRRLRICWHILRGRPVFVNVLTGYVSGGMIVHKLVVPPQSRVHAEAFLQAAVGDGVAMLIAYKLQPSQVEADPDIEKILREAEGK